MVTDADDGRRDMPRRGMGARRWPGWPASPWLAPWAADGGQTADYLLDLACARECAQADAVAGFGRPREYEFTRWLDEPALVRAHLLDPGGPAAGDWGSHGLRLFTIAAAGVL